MHIQFCVLKIKLFLMHFRVALHSHVVKITEISSRDFLKKKKKRKMLNQHFFFLLSHMYCIFRWFHEIFFNLEKIFVFPHCDKHPFKRLRGKRFCIKTIFLLRIPFTAISVPKIALLPQCRKIQCCQLFWANFELCHYKIEK